MSLKVETRIVQIEQEWAELRAYFLPFDAYVSHRVHVYHDHPDYVLASLTEQ